MPFRDWILRFLAISPFLAVGVVSARTRYFSDPYEPYSYSQAQQDTISAYVIPVRLTLASDVLHADRATARKIAKIWVDGSEQGILKPLPAASADDLTHSPIKSQIYLAEESLVRRLDALAGIEQRAGETGEQIQDQILAMQTCEVLKYSDPYAVDIMSSRQKGLLNLLEKSQPSLSAQQRHWVARQLVDLRNRQEPLDQLFHSFKNVWQEEQLREETNYRASYDPEHALETEVSKDDTSYSSAIKDALKTRDVLGPDYLTEFSMAYKSELRFAQWLNSAISAMNRSDHSVSA